MRKSQTILVVDDNVAMRKALVESLHILDYKTLEAGHGKEAIEILKQFYQHGENPEAPVLVLSDLSMPEMDGTELFHHMKENKINIPLIILTGFVESSDLIKLKQEGIAGWLIKPVGIEDLAGILSRIIIPGNNLINEDN